MSKIKLIFVEKLEMIYDAFIETGKYITNVDHSRQLAELFSKTIEYQDGKHTFDFNVRTVTDNQNTIYVYSIDVYRVGTILSRLKKNK